MELIFEERLSEHLLDFLLSGVSALPAVESGGANDLVDVFNHIGDDLRSGAVPQLKEYLCQRPGNTPSISQWLRGTAF